MKLKELKIILKTQKHPKMVAEKLSQFPRSNFEVKNWKAKTTFYHFYLHHNNPNVFLKIKETYGNLQSSKTFGKILAKRKLIDCKWQPSNLKRLLCSSNLSTNKPTFKTTKFIKSCFCCDYIIETELFKFKNWYQTFNLKSNLHCETPNLVYVIICCSWDRLSIHRQHIRQPEYEKTEVERHFHTCGKGMFKILPFFKVKENNKILRECYEDHFMKKFKPELNQRL